MKTNHAITLGLLVSLSAGAIADYAVNWFTIDNGGARTATGGAFALSGTIGQPDAGPMLTGGSFTLVGGFWSPPRTTCPADLDGNGTIDPSDSNFVMARFGCPVGTGDDACDRADLDQDGKVDPFDSNLVLSQFGDCP